MKKTMLIIAAVLCLCTQACAQEAQPAYLMTKDDMRAIYQQSFDRMNTTMEINLMTLDELPAWEENYTRQTGYERKDDLIISSLPMEGDKTYEEALGLAKGALEQFCGVTEKTLDEMGVYPLLMDYVYLPHESEWEFYFTPRRDTDILLDHDIPEEGEYRVVIGAQSGRIISCNWYHNELLPNSKLVALAEEAALEASGMDADAFADTYAPGQLHHYDQRTGTCLVLIYSQTADLPDGDNHVYQVIMDCKTGWIISMEYTDGVG